MALGKGLSSLIPDRAATASTPPLGSDRVWQIPIADIAPNPHQPRREFSHTDLEELMESIKEHGILQPLVVTELPSGKYELIAGERRLRASAFLGMLNVPCIVRVVKNREKLELAIIENVQRKNLNPIEEALAYKRLYDEFNLTQEQIGSQVGKTPSYVSQTLRLLELPEEVQQGLSEGKISKSHALAIVVLPTAGEQLRMYQSVVGTKITSGAVEEAIIRSGRKAGATRDPQIMDFERELREKFSAKVTISERKGRGSIKIEFYSKEELGGLIERLRK